VGGVQDDYLWGSIQTHDGAYVAAGSTASFGAGGVDVWAVKLNSDGTLDGSFAYGGTSDDYAYDLVETSAGQLVLAGGTMSFSNGQDDAWILKTRPDGSLPPVGTSVVPTVAATTVAGVDYPGVLTSVTPTVTPTSCTVTVTSAAPSIQAP